jgi:hypothetical protein
MASSLAHAELAAAKTAIIGTIDSFIRVIPAIRRHHQFGLPSLNRDFLTVPLFAK